jgi:hypothetical protein
MAETKRMTADEVVSYLLEGEEGLDFRLFGHCRGSVRAATGVEV